MKKALIFLMLFAAAWLFAQNTPLTLTSPNGGEQWQAGSTYPITWTQLNLAGSVSIYLLGTNSTQGTLITANIPVSAGEFAWAIPVTTLPATYYRIRISMATSAGYTISDISDAPFSIVPNSPPTTFIQVLHPNGGEEWVIGSTHMINWISSGLEGEVRITLVQANGVPDMEIATNVPIQNGSYSWTIPSTIPAGSGYRVHIMWLSMLTVYFGDVSDGTISILDSSPPPPTGLSILSPNGGEVWTAGTTQQISWLSTSLSGNVTLYLSHGPNTSALIPIAENIPVAAGVYSWAIPADIMPSETYYICIFSTAANGVILQSDYSDAAFSIVSDNPPPVQIITVQTPNGGETIVRGTNHTITWTDNAPNASPLPQRVNIWLIRMQGITRVRIPIAQNIMSTGSYNWRVPRRILPGNRYAVLIHRTGDPSIRDISDAPFSIVGQTMSIHASPNPTKGETSISIDSANGTLAQIDVYNIKGQKVRSLSQDMPLDGKAHIAWDGRDYKGQRVNSGIYFIRVNADGEISTQRLIMLKD